jgi:hypothetical protein
VRRSDSLNPQQRCERTSDSKHGFGRWTVGLALAACGCGATSAVMRVPIGGGVAIELGAQGGSAIVLDANNLYWLSGPAVVQLAK